MPIYVHARVCKLCEWLGWVGGGGGGGIGRNGCGPGKKPKDRNGCFFLFCFFNVGDSFLAMDIVCVLLAWDNLQGLSLGLPLSSH